MNEKLNNFPFQDEEMVYQNFVRWTIPVLYVNKKNPVFEDVDMLTYFKWLNSHPDRKPVISHLTREKAIALVEKEIK